MDRKLLMEKSSRILEGWSQLVEDAGDDEYSLRSLSFKHRYLIYGTESALTSYIASGSSGRENGRLACLAEKSLHLLLGSLNGDGTCNSVNIASPPDTAFVSERVGALMVLLRKGENQLPRSGALQSLLNDYLERTAEALLTGGIHTPNHRWVVTSALSYAYHLLGKEKYRRRAEEWLREGIDLDGDGQFCERSSSIYSPVSVQCLLNGAEYLSREDLYRPVSRHLTMNLAYFTPEGTLLTQASRRQDAFFPGDPGGYWLPYRMMAIREGNGSFSRAAQFIEEKGFYPSVGSTEYFSGRGAGTLPDPAGPVPGEGDRYFPDSGLFRSYEKGRFYALFGGSDREACHLQTSGLSNHPTILTFSKGPCRLESFRIAPLFFSTGYFRADEMEVDGGFCRLYRKITVPYFDRLPEKEINPEGSYKLSSTGRYWSKMDFPLRDRVNAQSLALSVETERKADALVLRIRAECGAPVPVALEFQFPPEGELKGEWMERSGNLSLLGNCPGTLPENVKILGKGPLVYSRKGQSLTIGPGRIEHDWLPCDQPADFFPLGEEMKTKRIVYIPLFAPFDTELAIKS